MRHCVLSVPHKPSLRRRSGPTPPLRLRGEYALAIQRHLKYRDALFLYFRSLCTARAPRETFLSCIGSLRRYPRIDRNDQKTADLTLARQTTEAHDYPRISCSRPCARSARCSGRRPISGASAGLEIEPRWATLTAADAEGPRWPAYPLDGEGVIFPTRAYTRAKPILTPAS